MSFMQESVILAERPTLEVGTRRATLRTPVEVFVSFRVIRVDALDTAEASRALDYASGTEDHQLVVFRTASPKAKALLRERGVSYAGDDGEWFLYAPPVYVERPAQRSKLPPEKAPYPFAPRASRVPRWLLLHSDESPSLNTLARQLELSEATVSRTARALASEGLVELVVDSRDTRVRRLRARSTAGLLEALERSAWPRRMTRQTWDIGTRDLAGAMSRWREAANDINAAPYAVGGLAGATTIRRVVEPADMLVWVRREDLAKWGDLLVAEPASPAPGRVTVQVAPDPFVLKLASEHDGVKIADPVQLYLDCRLAGERALDAALAIREVMGW
jgi:DNA-binding transcriptional ArsR family regulator